MDFLPQQLDCIGVDWPILDGLVLLGSGTHQRLQGGALLHACVCCAGENTVTAAQLKAQFIHVNLPLHG